MAKGIGFKERDKEFSDENYGGAADYVNVADEEDTLSIVDGEQRVNDDAYILQLQQMRDELGEEALTPEEMQLLDAFDMAMNREPGEHFENLAEYVADSDLKKLAMEVLQWVEWDDDSRKEWQEIEKRGIRQLGVSPNVDKGAAFAGASIAVHPALGEACVQFNSRAMNVLWPAGGPVKGMVLGDTSDELEQQAKRVSGFMNYQYTELMAGAYEQTDQMMLRLPLSGSIFTKAYFDPVDGVTRRKVEPADFIVPYNATDLRTSPRHTERVLITPNDVRKRQVKGLYLDMELGNPSDIIDSDNREIIDDEIKATEGRADNAAVVEDYRRTLYECFCEIDLPGFEDKDKNGKPTGIKLPYLVVVDDDDEVVLGIYRNWKERDTTKRKIILHTHYRFIPGLGFYGYGFYHWIGSLSQAATGALRALLDAAAFSNMPGGFRAKDAGLKNGDLKIGPGEWAEVDADAEDLSKAFFKLPYSEPSAVLFNLLGHIEGLVQRFVGTTEALTGGGKENTPVGTMLARIEQGGKILTQIQERLHYAQKCEFRIIAWLNSLYMPDEYPYLVANEAQTALRQDFDERVDVVPVSDPNIISNAQRYFISQTILDLANAAPDLFDRRVANRRVLEALRVQDIDELLPEPEETIQRLGPVAEIDAVLKGKPIQAYIEQDHQAHIVIHRSFLEQIATDKDMAQQASALMAHIQEHVAQAFTVQVAMATGIPIELLMGGEQVPVELENQIAVATAQAMQQLALPQAPDPESEKAQADIQRKDMQAQADIQRKDQLAMADMQRQDAIAKAKIQNEAESTLAKLTRDNEQQIAELQQGFLGGE